MSALFNYHDSSSEPPLVRFDTLAKTHGPEPAHLLADRDCPLIVAIGPARYVAREDLAWFLHKRAEEALARRRSGTVPEPYASELMDAVRKATGEDRFYVPGGLSERSKSEPEPVT